MTAHTDSLRFLVVDDDADIRTVLVHMIERLGHHADQAGDGVQAVEALAVQRYDFVLLDLTMPRMTGEDVLRWLSDHRTWGAGVRAIVVSAWAEKHADALVGLGAHTVLAKPVRLWQLRDVIADGELGAASSSRAGGAVDVA